MKEHTARAGVHRHVFLGSGLGPGHLGAVLSVVTLEPRDPNFYRTRLECFKSLSHVTVEVVNANSAVRAAL